MRISLARVMCTTQTFSVVVLPFLMFQFAVATTQPSFISSASTCAGVAAAAGELAKDARHQDAVEETGCDFIPLVVETFGVWSPFALRILRTIADHTTTRSGASTKLARKHLLQQLSVSLWTNNSRMILWYWALQGDDSDFPFVRQLI